MTTVTRSLTSDEAHRLRGHHAYLRRLTRRCVERMSIPVCGWLGFLLIWTFTPPDHSICHTAGIVAIALLPFAVIVSVGWHWSEFRQAKSALRHDRMLLKRGEVIEEHHHAARAVKVHFLAAAPDPRPVDGADYLYDVGDGHILYLHAAWSDGQASPQPRSELTLVWSMDHKELLYVTTAGEPLDAIHAHTPDRITLPSGTLLPGGLYSVLAAIGAKMNVQPAC